MLNVVAIGFNDFKNKGFRIAVAAVVAAAVLEIMMRPSR